mgnify:CR=1 FL=1
MQVMLLDESQNARWDSFVAQHPEGEFFHLSGWLQVIREAYGHPCWFYYVEDQGEILAVLPLAQINSWLFGNKLISLPLCFIMLRFRDCKIWVGQLIQKGVEKNLNL